MLFKNINTVAYETIITSNAHGEIFQVFSLLVVLLWKKCPWLPCSFMHDTSADKLSICLLKRPVEKQNLRKHESCTDFFFSLSDRKTLWHLRKILHRIHKNGVFGILVAKQMPSGVQLQNTGIRWILWMFNHVHKWVGCNMHSNVRCKYQAWWDVHVASHEKCSFSVPLGGVLAFKGIRKILLQQVPHHCHAPPV